jgi:hypothetical protein
MPDRAVIPLISSLAAGFIAGCVMAITQQFGGPVWTVGIVVGAALAVIGYLSTLRVDTEDGERRMVAVLRGLLAAACFGFLYAGLVIALRDGSFVGVLFMLLSGLFAGLLVQIRARDRGELHPTT